jgi:hypothetical protein
MTRAEQILEMYRYIEEGAGAKAVGATALGASGYGIYKKHFAKAKDAAKGAGVTKEGVKNVGRKTASKIANVMQSDRARELGHVMRHLKNN